MSSARRCASALLVAALIFLCAPLSHPALAQDIEVQHVQGKTQVPLNPKTVIVFDLASLDTLDALGVEVTGVPGGIMPDYLSKYGADGVAKVGSLFEPDFEAVAALSPDLIIVSGRSAPKYDALSKIAPTIDLSVDGARYLENAQQNVRTLGRIFGKEEQAEQALARLDASTAALKNKLSHAGSGLLILTTGGKMSVYGPGSRFGLLFTDLGLRSTDENIKVGLHGQPASFEYILEQNPDWLFVIDRDAAIGQKARPSQQLLDNEIVGRTNAWRKGQVVYLDPMNWYLVGGGLTSLQQTVDQVSQALDGSGTKAR